MKAHIVAAFICICPAVAQNSASIRIHVIDSLTKAPIAGAKLTLDGSKDAPVVASTDHTGVFTGHLESQGQHLLGARHRGYRMIGAGLMGKIIDIQLAKPNEFTVEMLPLAVLAGRVLDQYGDPVRHAIVSTQAKRSSPVGGEQYQSLFADLTDDRGEYRLADVEPGKYYLVIEYSSNDQRLYGLRSRYIWPEFGGMALFPDAPDIEHAQQVEARAGETTRLPDARLMMSQGVKIAGRVTPPPKGRAFVEVQRDGPSLSRHQSGIMNTNIAADGAFSVDVLPGNYSVRATDSSGRMSPISKIAARDKDVVNLELPLGQGYEISGRIVVDGAEHLDFSKVVLHFLGQPVKIDAAGTFHDQAVHSEAAYMIQGLPPGWYVKEFRVGGRSIRGRQFQLEVGNTEAVLTVSPRGGQVEFAAEDHSDADGFMLGAMFLLLPENGAVDVESMLRSEGRDSSGRVTIHGVPPGEYRAFALGVSNLALLFDPGSLLAKYRNLAPLVTITEGEHKKIVVPPTKIPVE